MLFNSTFNNISVISWRSFLSVEEIGVLGENHRRAGYFIKQSLELRVCLFDGV